MAESDKQLLPCPFCGHKPEMVCKSTSASSNAQNGFTRFFKLWCPNCGCNLGSPAVPVTFDYSPYTGLRADETELHKAIEKWNRRADHGRE